MGPFLRLGVLFVSFVYSVKIVCDVNFCLLTAGLFLRLLGDSKWISTQEWAHKKGFDRVKQPSFCQVFKHDMTSWWLSNRINLYDFLMLKALNQSCIFLLPSLFAISVGWLTESFLILYGHEPNLCGSVKLGILFHLQLFQHFLSFPSLVCFSKIHLFYFYYLIQYLKDEFVLNKNIMAIPCWT